MGYCTALLWDSSVGFLIDGCIIACPSLWASTLWVVGYLWALDCGRSRNEILFRSSRPVAVLSGLILGALIKQAALSL